MTEPQDVVDTRTSYAAFATEYTEHVRHELDRFPLARALLSHFAELVQAGGGGPVADLALGAGLEVVVRTRQERQQGELTPQGFVLARKPASAGDDGAP